MNYDNTPERPLSEPLIELATHAYVERIEEIAAMYQQAFAGAPWFEDLSDQEVMKRVKEHALMPGFEAFIAKSEEDRIIGGLWYDTPSRETLVAERGEEIGEFTKAVRKSTGVDSLVWARESIVCPEAQGKGIATRLRREFLAHVADQNPDGALILTRMRSDNHGIIKVATRFGYAPTGIQMPSSMAPGAYHEYWYRLVNDPRDAYE